VKNLLKIALFTTLFLITAAQMEANQVSEQTWQTNMTFYDYLVANNIAPLILAELDDETYGELKTIGDKTQFYEHRDAETGVLLHALIPIREEQQISLYRIAPNDEEIYAAQNFPRAYSLAAEEPKKETPQENAKKYKIEIVPIKYMIVNETLHTRIQNSIQVDLREITGNNKLSTELSAIYDTRVDFRRDVQRNDSIAAIYDRKIRLGRTWGAILVHSAFLELRKNRIYAFYRQEDEAYYDDIGNTLLSMFIERPIEYARVTSGYMPGGRMHPIYGYERPHLGVDFAAPTGTPVYSVGDGTVRFAGCQKSCDQGYGKVVVVEHRNGWETRYAHLNGFSKISGGSRVKQGQLIGYVGSSGVTTGSHVHFEVRKGGGPTNPLSLRNVRKDGLKNEEKVAFLKKARDLKATIDYVALKNSNGVTRLSATFHNEMKKRATQN
jgi:murein DD-endopeptidase MepM/ murein hydrolase activator NlpD